MTKRFEKGDIIKFASCKNSDRMIHGVVVGVDSVGDTAARVVESESSFRGGFGVDVGKGEEFKVPDGDCYRWVFASTPAVKVSVFPIGSALRIERDGEETYIGRVLGYDDGDILTQRLTCKDKGCEADEFDANEYRDDFLGEYLSVPEGETYDWIFCLHDGYYAKLTQLTEAELEVELNPAVTTSQTTWVGASDECILADLQSMLHVDPISQALVTAPKKAHPIAVILKHVMNCNLSASTSYDVAFDELTDSLNEQQMRNALGRYVDLIDSALPVEKLEEMSDKTYYTIRAICACRAVMDAASDSPTDGPNRRPFIYVTNV